MVLGDDCDDGAVLLEGRPRLGLPLPQLPIIRVMFIVIEGPAGDVRQEQWASTRY